MSNGRLAARGSVSPPCFPLFTTRIFAHPWLVLFRPCCESQRRPPRGLASHAARLRLHRARVRPTHPELRIPPISYPNVIDGPDHDDGSRDNEETVALPSALFVRGIEVLEIEQQIHRLQKENEGTWKV